MIKEAEILEIANKLNRIIDDDTPFLMRKNNEIFVIGNATKTSVKKHDYILEFEDESGEITQKMFSNKSVTPRRNFTIITPIFNLLIIFHNIDADGTIIPRSDDEILHIFATEYDTACTFIKNVISAFLDVESNTLKDITLDSLITTLSELITNHPETFNEADVYYRIAHNKDQKQEPPDDSEETYFVKLDSYSHMAQYVGKALKIRPNDILDHWGVAELIVTFGSYRNEETYRNFLEWKALDMETKKKVKRPEPFAVKFYTHEELEYEE